MRYIFIVVCSALLITLAWGLKLGAPAQSATAGEAHVESQNQPTAVFAGGCFWGVDAVFRHVKGVTSVESGYAGGNAETAHYDQVSKGDTGHAESVRVRFDPTKVSYRQLLEVFFKVAHDPTQRNRQGPDEGGQYRSAIFYTSAEQQHVAEDYVRELTDEHVFAAPIVTQIVPLPEFYPAEEYHQNFYALHQYMGYIIAYDVPKLRHLREQYPGLYQ